MNVTLKIISNSYPPVSYFGILVQDDEVRLTTCPYSDQKSVVKNAKHLARLHGYTIARIVPYQRDKKSRSLVKPGAGETRRSTIGANYLTGGVLLDCNHCGEYLLLHEAPSGHGGCTGLNFQEIAEVFRKAHTHKA